MTFVISWHSICIFRRYKPLRLNTCRPITSRGYRKNTHSNYLTTSKLIQPLARKTAILLNTLSLYVDYELLTDFTSTKNNLVIQSVFDVSTISVAVFGMSISAHISSPGNRNSQGVGSWRHAVTWYDTSRRHVYDTTEFFLSRNAVHSKISSADVQMLV